MERSMEELQSELDAMIGRIEQVQAERRLPTYRLVNEYPDLGSAKTWSDRLVKRQWAEINIPRWHHKISRVIAILDGGTPDEQYWTELNFHREMAARLTRLERQTNDRRILVCLAPNGCGKSAFTRWAVAQQFNRRAVVRMRPSYRGKPLHIYHGMMRELGEELATSNVAAAEDAVIKELRTRPRTMFLDQAHEAGVALMHILRALVDETPSRFVYLAYDTAWRQVMCQSTDAQIEAQAFMGRCLKPIFDLYRDGIRAEDCSVYLQRMAGLNKVVAGSLAARLVETLNARNNLRLLEDAITAAVAGDATDYPTPDTIEAKVLELGRVQGRTVNAATRKEEE